MTEEQFLDVKEGYLNNIKSYIADAGGLFPHISVFAEHKDVTKKGCAIIHIPIPDELMKTDRKKDEFVEKIFPEIIKEINASFDVKGVAWASEAWMREAPKGTPLDVKNYKDLPIKKEVVIVTMETDHSNSTTIYEMKRSGKKVNEDGDLIDDINLVELENVQQGDHYSGRFTGLYKKFTANC